MWDKKSKKVFSTGVNAVGAERDFYTLDKLDDPYLWEHMYSTGIEPLMSKVIPSVISRVNILLKWNDRYKCHRKSATGFNNGYTNATREAVPGI